MSPELVSSPLPYTLFSARFLLFAPFLLSLSTLLPHALRQQFSKLGLLPPLFLPSLFPYKPPGIQELKGEEEEEGREGA